MKEDVWAHIAEAYDFPGELISAVPFGSGCINDTVCLTYHEATRDRRYVLQKINRQVFAHPEELMSNMLLVTDFLRMKIQAAGGDPERETLRVMTTKDGQPFRMDETGEYWRITGYIENSLSLDVARTSTDLYEAGRAFGLFQAALADFPAERLYETIPGFHDTLARFTRFARLIQTGPKRTASCRAEIEAVLSRNDLARYAAEHREAGELPLRVTHNDTKLNNVLLDATTGKALCVIDLDTVMPGLVLNDFGDAIRYGASTATENEKDLSKVHFCMENFSAYSQGYLESVGRGVSEKEIKSLAMGALCMTYEQALRFLEDYLKGDVYYKTDYPEQNLVRCRTQLTLLREMQTVLPQMQKTVETLAKQR